MTNTNTAAARVATDSDDALMAREVYESQDDSLLLCASDLQHSAIYDNHIEMQSCIRAVADRITALASVIEGVERAVLAAPAQALDAARVFWQQHTQADALSMTMAELHDDVEIVIRAARGAAQAAPVDATNWQPVAVPAAWAATSEEGNVEALGMNQSRRFDTPLYAAPQPAAQALDAGQWTQEDLREFCAIGRATNRAAGDLPDFARIRIDLENGAGTVYWLDNKSGQWRYIDSGDLFSTQIDAATDAAIAAQQGGA